MTILRIIACVLGILCYLAVLFWALSLFWVSAQIDRCMPQDPPPPEDQEKP